MRKAFLLEDNVLNAQLAVQYLKMAGIDHVEWCRTIAAAEDALCGIEHHEYEALIFDVHLEDGFSHDLAEHLKSKKFRNICAYTAKWDDTDDVTVTAKSFDHIFLKPISPDKFVQEYKALVHGTATLH